MESILSSFTITFQIFFGKRHDCECYSYKKKHAHIDDYITKMVLNRCKVSWLQILRKYDFEISCFGLSTDWSSFSQIFALV